jgi:peptidoglycan glycosyltransferase
MAGSNRPLLLGRRIPIGTALGRVGISLAVAFGGLAAGAGYWQVFRSPELSRAPDDAAVIAASRHIIRGVISDRDGKTLASSKRDKHGEPYRVYVDDSLSGVLGYSSRQFGNFLLEAAWNAELSGVATADPLLDLTRKFRSDPSDPQALRTTLVLQLQKAAVAALGSHRGAVVMLDPRTGEILAMASTPTYDASRVANPDTAGDAMTALQADKALPLLPRATQGLYVPGSIFKIVTATAALSSGAIRPSTTYSQQPAAEKTGLLVSGFRVRDGHHAVTDGTALDFDKAVEVSCNIYFALTGLRTGGEALADGAARLGFGAPLPFDLPTRRSQVTGGGGSFGGGFSDDVELANAAYGQGETLVTPLQMALVAAAVANHGVIMKPYLVRSASGRAGTTTFSPSAWQTAMTPAVAADIAAAMRLAVNGDLGRQFTSGARVSGLTVAGKSGTAELDPGTRPHSWFIGFAPYDDPQVAIAVLVEHGGFDTRASPLAGDLFRAWRTWANR